MIVRVGCAPERSVELEGIGHEAILQRVETTLFYYLCITTLTYTSFFVIVRPSSMSTSRKPLCAYIPTGELTMLE